MGASVGGSSGAAQLKRAGQDVSLPPRGRRQPELHEHTASC